MRGGVTAALGYTACGVRCGIRRGKNKRDLALIVSDRPASAAAVYTQNRVQGAPLQVNREHLANGRAQAILCNSGIANTCAPDGPEKARAMCALAAEALNIEEDDVLVGSTGVIGPSLPIEPIERALPEMVKALSAAGSPDAAEAIMTTDTVKKEAAVTFTLSGVTCVLGGIAKGSGMIAPHMATLLAFLTTDAAIDAGLLETALRGEAEDTFNMLSVDGDTSTNDNVVLLANGAAGNPPVTSESEDYRVFCEALHTVCRRLCRMLAKDGEGASRLMEVRVTGAKTREDARRMAQAVNRSALVKTAVFGADANFGRVLCAIGYSGADADVAGVSGGYRSRAGSITVCEEGRMLPFDETLAKTVLSEDEIIIDIALSEGDGEAVAYGCDFTYDYVRINGDYRS